MVKDTFVCPGLSMDFEEFYIKNNKLPKPCDSCFTVLIKSNVLEKFDLPKCAIKNDTATICFNNMSAAQRFVASIDLKKQGIISWRKCCPYYQELIPMLWNNTKELKQPSKKLTEFN